MRKADILNVIATFCSIAVLKETEYECVSVVTKQDNKEMVATHVFGAQQLAWLYWSEGEFELDIFKVNTLLAFHKIQNKNLPDELKVFVDEFTQNSSVEAKFAHLCSDLEEWLQYVNTEFTDDLAEFISGKYKDFLISSEDIKNVILHYDILCELKRKVRRGWISWNVNVEHREVVSEHVFGTQVLAWLMYLATNSDVNITKVTAMMALHETEESIMEDYIPVDAVCQEQLIAEGRDAVKKVLGGIKKFDIINDLLEEFNGHQTPEAKFSYLCDKLECNFRAKMYDDLGLCPMENGTEEAKNDPEVAQHLAKGAKNVSDFFMMPIMHAYVGTPFEEIINTLRYYDTSKIN